MIDKLNLSLAEHKSAENVKKILSFCKANKIVENDLNDSLIVWDFEPDVPLIYDVNLDKWFWRDNNLSLENMYIIPKIEMLNNIGSDFYLNITSPITQHQRAELLEDMGLFAKKYGEKINWRKALA